jgi:hypothetical protein
MSSTTTFAAQSPEGLAHSIARHVGVVVLTTVLGLVLIGPGAAAS